MSVTYLLGVGELADPETLSCLRIGARLGLRHPPAVPGGSRRDRRGIEVCAPDGRRLGHLPPEDARFVEALMETGVAARARVVALVPCFRRSRVQIEIEVVGSIGSEDTPPCGASSSTSRTGFGSTSPCST